MVRNSWAHHRLIYLVGEAGTGKTTAALAEALRDVFEGRARKVYLGRPMVAAGERYGFLPGYLDEKTLPWLGAVNDALGGFSDLSLHVLKNHVEVVQVGLLRGRTISDGTLIIDEAQNLSWDQIEMLGSRIGTGRRVVLAGDTEQSDLPDRHLGSPLRDAANATKGVAGTKVIRFLPEDQMRDPFVTAFLRAMRMARSTVGTRAQDISSAVGWLYTNSL
jgi:phosphate starvation-inducible PhoH-like protein